MRHEFSRKVLLKPIHSTVFWWTSKRFQIVWSSHRLCHHTTIHMSRVNPERIHIRIVPENRHKWATNQLYTDFVARFYELHHRLPSIHHGSNLPLQSSLWCLCSVISQRQKSRAICCERAREQSLWSSFRHWLSIPRALVRAIQMSHCKWEVLRISWALENRFVQRMEDVADDRWARTC